MSGINLEEQIAQLEFNYGGVLQKLAELHDAVVNQLEEVKTAGVKIRREKTSYVSGTVLACVGRNNGNKFLKAQNTGTTAEGTKDESFYDSLEINATWIDGGVTWKVVEEAFTSGSIVESAMNASHAEIADFASSATEAGYASSAGYIGPFHVISTGEQSGVVISGNTYGGISFVLQDDTRPIGTGGVIVNGPNTILIASSAGFLPEGKTLYLLGSSGNVGSSFSCVWYVDGVTPPSTMSENEFLTALAKNSGGKVEQMQFGDIVTPWPGNTDSLYDGPFKVSVDSINSQTNTVNVTIHDPTDITTDKRYAGRVFANENRYYVFSSSISDVPDSQYIYLIGNSQAGDNISFSMTTTIPSTLTEGMFYTRLAQNKGGKIVQIQYGDIAIPPWKVTLADSALNAEYKGPFHVSGYGTGNNVKIYDDTRPGNYGGCVVVGNSSVIISSGTTSLENGYRLYLVGTSTTQGIQLNYSKIQDGTTISPAANEFYTQLAFRLGGKVYQAQFGDIVQPFFGGQVEQEYNGPFKVESTAVVDSATGVLNVKIYDPTDPSTNPYNAGRVFADGAKLLVPSSAINNVSNGDFIYLVGNSAQGQIPSFSMTTSSPQVVHGRFITRLAKNEGGKLIQIQYGDITVPPWSVDFASSALVAQTAESTEVADYASSAGYMGPFHVSNVGGNSVTVFDDTRTGNIGGCVVLGSVISSVSSASGLNLPNEYKLYLVGSSGINGYSFTYSSGSGVIIPGTNEFWTQLAYNNGGTIIQTQFGDIVQPQINISGSGSAEFPNWGQTNWHTSHLGSGLGHLYQAPVDGWLIANANIYKDPSSTGQTCVEVFFGGGPNDPYGRVNRVVLNKLHTMEDQYEMSIMNGQVIQVHSGCYFNILCTDGDATNPTYESSPDFSVTLDCYFCSNENFTL